AGGAEGHAQVRVHVEAHHHVAAAEEGLGPRVGDDHRGVHREGVRAERRLAAAIVPAPPLGLHAAPDPVAVAGTAYDAHHHDREGEDALDLREQPRARVALARRERVESVDLTGALLVAGSADVTARHLAGRVEEALRLALRAR